MCNVKGVAYSNKTTKNIHQALHFLSIEFYSVFQVIVLLLRPATLLFWCTLTALGSAAVVSSKN